MGEGQEIQYGRQHGGGAFRRSRRCLSDDGRRRRRPCGPMRDRHVVASHRACIHHTLLGDLHDRSSLKTLGTVGEPINPEAWNWYYNVVGDGRCDIVDTYWQTETGGHVVTGLSGTTPMKPGSASFPFYGIELCVMKPTVEDAVSDAPRRHPYISSSTCL